jgi:hypothetical protein
VPSKLDEHWLKPIVFSVDVDAIEKWGTCGKRERVGGALLSITSVSPGYVLVSFFAHGWAAAVRADFGFSRVKETNRETEYTQSTIGPIKWMAPEVCTVYHVGPCWCT